MIGEDYELSILAPHWAWEAGAAVFELWDGERSLTYWVRKIPTPRQTATLLTKHGGRPRKSEANPASSIPSAAKEADPTNAASRTRAPESYTRMVHAGLRAGPAVVRRVWIGVDEPAKAVRTLGHTSFPHRTPSPDPVRLRHDRSETLAKKFLADWG